jgi:hypothetical protein
MGSNQKTALGPKMRRIKRLLQTVVFSLFVCMVGFLTGCAGSPGRTVKEVDQQHYHAIHSTWLMFQEDIDAILMLDQPSRLTPMYTR